VFGVYKGARLAGGSFFTLCGERKRVPLWWNFRPRAALGNKSKRTLSLSVTLPNSDARVINRLFLCNKHSPVGNVIVRPWSLSYFSSLSAGTSSICAWIKAVKYICHQLKGRKWCVIQISFLCRGCYTPLYSALDGIYFFTFLLNWVVVTRQVHNTKRDSITPIKCFSQQEYIELHMQSHTRGEQWNFFISSEAQFACEKPLWWIYAWAEKTFSGKLHFKISTSVDTQSYIIQSKIYNFN